VNSFQQGDAIRDYVFPLCTIANPDDEAPWRFDRFLGTAFVIGDRGYALTAAHVIPQSAVARIAGVFVTGEGRWWAARVIEHETHPTEDVSLLRLAGAPWKSFFRLSNTWEGASAKYQMWGYPEDVAQELGAEGRVVDRPDLVYAEGYVRRRLAAHAIPTTRGAEFFEVSELVGPGCSGAPLYINRRPFWDVIGIYVGERLNDRATSVAYAVREDAFRGWVPAATGRSLLEEAAAAAVV
jgi:Trypsin-like peptidase domain